MRPGKVTALIHQVRTTLIAEREARDTPCAIREQLSTARAGALRRGPLRRHLRRCAGCRADREAVAALALPAAVLGLPLGAWIFMLVIGATDPADGPDVRTLPVWW